MNMSKWLNDQLNALEKHPIPVLSFPGVSLTGITVRELVQNSELQASVMKAVADRIPSGASVSMMDLSVEAEAFGSKVRMSDEEVPAIVGSIVTSEAEATELRVPKVGEGRTGIYINAIKMAASEIKDRPVFAGIIGPFSLAGRLIGVTEALMSCYDDPTMVHAVLEKATGFLIDYAKAYETVGAAGLVMAEPLTGMLSPALAEEFSEPYVKKIISTVQSDSFKVIYHNCGNNTVLMMDSLLRTGASAYHFGNSVDMLDVLIKMPGDIIALGNLDPAGIFRNGDPSLVRASTLELLERCSGYNNFIISSGCDIPPATPWENIDAFFAAVEEYYSSRR